MTARPILCALAALTLGVVQAEAQSGNGKGKGKPSNQGEVAHARIKGPGTDVEIRIIRDFYSARSHKPKSLPPGVAKNLTRGKSLPPGIAHKQVPDDLIVLLPVRTGTRWLIAGDVVLLVDAGDLIVDLIRLVF